MARDIFDGDRKYNPLHWWDTRMDDSGGVDLPSSDPSNRGSSSPGGGGLPWFGGTSGSTGVPSAGWGAGSVGAGAGVGGGMGSASAALWLAALQGGLGLLGGAMAGNPYQERQSFGGNVSAQNLLQQAMSAIQGSKGAIGARAPVRLRPVQSISPVNVPGLPFQIGGGFGTDPALRNPDMLTYQMPQFEQMNQAAAGGAGTAMPRPGGEPPKAKSRRGRV